MAQHSRPRPDGQRQGFSWAWGCYLPGVSGGLAPVLDMELVQDTAEMRLDGILTDEQTSGYLLVGVALADQLQYLQFAPRQGEVIGRSRGRQ